ncbi:MAG: gliding motility lipoprotein GldH [Flavobacteriales bacterium]|nr:gliding motility lipoprotein GldH [Flavobacteriales bacterium]
MRKKKQNIFFISLLFLLFAMQSCTDDTLYMHTHKFSNNQWKQNEKPIFKVDFAGDTITYDVIFTLRSTTDYAYNNIWLYITTKGPDCKKLSQSKSILGKAPVEIKMAKPNGEWIGSKSGTYIDHKLKFRQRRFCKGSYSFQLEQAVTIGQLDELSDLTIEVKPTIW